MKQTLLNNFLRYVKIDTMSDEETNQTPSTQKQFNLAKVLVEELKALGLKDIYLSDNCFVYATLPSNIKGNKESIGFIAHMDTIPGFSGTDVKPNVIENYNGKTIPLKGIELNPKQFPFLKDLKGKTLITTDGTTVLGADDKAGIAIIMSMLSHYVKTNEPHVEIHVAFTPDEEIGSGIEHFDLTKFPCSYAYTIDGGEYDMINYENFNAASATIQVHGLDIHPGSAKNQMKNASEIAMELHQMLPKEQKPEYTENYEGFIHLTHIDGMVGEAKLSYIIRDHDRVLLEKKKSILKEAASYINKKYGKDTVKLEIKDSYFNMAEIIKQNPVCLERAKQAMEALGITPTASPIRGGTDGARLTFMGLPTPNLGTGGYNCHGPYEFACLEEMELLTKIVIEITKIK
ncbi:MAG: peptidase T [Anaeroplasmataceae bacterium]|nr:peptidase T [Anaeroplasmataceae bacterium]MDE6414632.1 peptidase T [Anaeroplasmataceae bacterium]